EGASHPCIISEAVPRPIVFRKLRRSIFLSLIEASLYKEDNNKRLKTRACNILRRTGHVKPLNTDKITALY
ncbi:MAG: hypothetical protein ACYSR9_11060, partial [Planctomycetota bacterium]